MQLVEHDQGRAGGPSGRPDLPAILAIVPVQVQPGARAGEDAPGQRRLADLPGAGDEDHLAGQVLPDRGLQVAAAHHGRIVRDGTK